MSKRKKNYPDPMEIVHKYGADALRYKKLFPYFMSTCNNEVFMLLGLHWKMSEWTGKLKAASDLFFPAL